MFTYRLFGILMTMYYDYLSAITQVKRFCNAFVPATYLFFEPLVSFIQDSDFFEKSPYFFTVNKRVMRLLNLIYSINVDEIPKDSLSSYYQLKDQVENQFDKFTSYLNEFLHWTDIEWPGILESLETIEKKSNAYLKLNFFKRFSYKSKELYPIIKKICGDYRDDWDKTSLELKILFHNLIQYNNLVEKTLSNVTRLISIVEINPKQHINQIHNHQDTPNDEIKTKDILTDLKPVEIETFHMRPNQETPGKLY